MQPKSVWEYIALGIDIGSLRFSQIIPEEWKHEPEIDLSTVSPDELIEKFENLDLLGARGIARLIKSEKAQYFNDISVHYLDALISVLESETERIQVFTVGEKRWDTQKLLNNVSALFAPRVFSQMHETAQSDFSEAGKCIAFELPNAAASLLLRGTEMVLREYYRAITGSNPSRPDWGFLINELRKTETLNTKPLHNNLDHIRDDYRNRTQHPDKIWNIEDAQDLFGRCIDVVDQMIPIIAQQEDIKRPASN